MGASASVQEKVLQASSDGDIQKLKVGRMSETWERDGFLTASWDVAEPNCFTSCRSTLLMMRMGV